MPGVSPVGLAEKGTVTGMYSDSEERVLRFCDLVISHRLPYSPSLHRVLLHGFIATMRTLTSVEPLLPVLTDVAVSLPLVCHDMLLTGPGPFSLERSQLPYFTIITIHDLFSTDLSAYLV
jgi:hypothetical protein